MINPKNFDLLNETLEGANLIEASAGTGKTYSIEGIFLRLLIEKEIPIENILAVTFTEAAASELKSRIVNRLHNMQILFDDDPKYDTSDELSLSLYNKYKSDNSQNHYDAISHKKLLVKRALQNIDEATISTIHSFCLKVLRENAFESGSYFDTDFLDNETSLKQEILHDYIRINFHNADITYLQIYDIMKFNQQELIKIQNIYNSKISIQIIPDDLDNSGFNPEIITEVLNRRNDIRKVFEKEKDLIIKFIINNKEKLNKIVKWENALDKCSAYFTDKDCFNVDGLDKICGNYISSKISKSKTIEESEFPEFLILNNDYLLFLKESQMMIKKFLVWKKYDFAKYYNTELQNRKREKRVWSFNDLLIELNNALNEQGSSKFKEIVSSKYSAVMIDEFQDTDPVQYDIFMKLFNYDGKTIFFIGDPKQSIYSFRNADIFSYIKVYSDCRSFWTITTNFRSSEKYLKALNNIFNRNNPFLINAIVFQEAVSPVENSMNLFIDGDDNSAMKFIFQETDEKLSAETSMSYIIEESISEIKKLLAYSDKGSAYFINKKNIKKPITTKDIAFIVRTNNEAENIHNALSKENIPSVMYSERSIVDTDEMSEIKLILNAVNNYRDRKSVVTALSTEIWGYNAENILSITTDENIFNSILYRLQEYRHIWDKYGFISFFKIFLTRENIHSNIFSLNKSRRRMTNINHIAEILHNTAVRYSLGINGLMKFIEQDINDEKKDSFEIRIETDSESIKILTIHKSKGLQFPIVFMPFLYKKPRDNDAIVFHKDNQIFMDISEGLYEEDEYMKNINISDYETAAENLRLLYVALTRAEYRTYIGWAKTDGLKNTPLAYLIHCKSDITPDTFTAVVKNFKIEYSDIINDLNILYNKSGGTISFLPAHNGENYPFDARDSKPPDFKIRENHVTITQSFQINSFTSIVHSDNEFRQTALSSASSLTDNALTYDDLKTGALSGIFIHSIMQNCDFHNLTHDVLEKLIIETAEKYFIKNINVEKIRETILNITTGKIISKCDKISLNNIQKNNIIKETEFHFSVDSINYSLIKSLLSEYYGYVDFPDNQNIASSGFMKGVIDAVIENNGKFYIIDWKSNFLGNSIKDYGESNIIEQMRNNFYHLQYLIYLVAVNRYLANILPDYNYENSFGGIFYIFIRGFNEKSGTGVFYDLPEYDIVRKMELALGSQN